MKKMQIKNNWTFEQPVLEEAQYTELENDKPIDVSDFEEIKEPATEKESEEEPF